MTIAVLLLLFCMMVVAGGQPVRAAVPAADAPPRGSTAAVPKAAPAQPSARPDKPAQAATDSPPPGAAEYRLGPGDIVKISVYNHPDLAIETEVSHDGKISFPLVGEVLLGGLTRAGAEKLIADRLASGDFVPKAHVNILISQYRSQQVSVMGEVHRPGKYPIAQAVGVTDVLAMAGGITPKGSQIITVIQKDRHGKIVQQEINVKNLLAGTDASRDIRLGNEDVIIVPPLPVFYIYGEVRQPGSYPLAEDLTIRQALSLGGGLTVRGTERGIKLERKTKDGKVRTYQPQPSDRVEPNDVLHVPESWF